MPSSSRRKAVASVLLGQSDKKSPEKSGFDFFGDFVLTEGLGSGAGQRAERNERNDVFNSYAYI
ncbi:hypothetical protein K4G93_21520, partial [Mycobacterium tuberculosis]|nr:hypothetical protein [Mycobacterium tuberculosis]